MCKYFLSFCSPQEKRHEHETLIMLGLPHVAHTLTAVFTSDPDVATPLSPTSLTYQEAHKEKKK